MSELRDPRTFRVALRTGWGPGDGIHFPRIDDDLARRVAGENFEIAEDDLEHYSPGDVVEGRIPISSVSVLLGRGLIEEVEATSTIGAIARNKPNATQAAVERAAEVVLDLLTVWGTGHGGRVTLADVEGVLIENADEDEDEEVE